MTLETRNCRYLHAYVAGKLLLKLGYKPSEAIALIREKRSPYALNNKHFEAALLNS
jgi:hypothetical protein